MITSYAHGEVSVKNEATLFSMDNYTIPFIRNLCLNINGVEKYPGNPVIPRGEEGAPDHKMAKFYGTVLHIDGKFRMWYNAIPDLDIGIHKPTNMEEAERFAKEYSRDKRYIYVAYAESEDGVNWVKPKLGLKEFDGNMDNNLVDLPGHFMFFSSVIFDEDEIDPDRKYKMVYEYFPNWNEPWGTQIAGVTAFAVSGDGLRWKLVSEGSPMKQMFEAGTLYKFNGNYFVGGQQGSPVVMLPPGSQESGRLMVIFQSPSFEEWPLEKSIAFYKPILTSSPDFEGYDGEEVHLGASVISRGNVCLGVYGQFHYPRSYGSQRFNSHNISCDLGLVISNDGIHYREPIPGTTFIKRDQELTWDILYKDKKNVVDKCMLLQGNALVNVGEKTYVWYSAMTPVGLNTGIAKANIGLATLRRDGFMYYELQMNSKDGSLLTCPFKVDGEYGLYANVEGINEDNPLYIEAVKEGGLEAIEGYSVQDIMPVTLEGVKVELKRSNGEALLLPEGIKFQLRAFIRGATKFYAFYISLKDRSGNYCQDINSNDKGRDQ